MVTKFKSFVIYMRRNGETDSEIFVAINFFHKKNLHNFVNLCFRYLRIDA